MNTEVNEWGEPVTTSQTQPVPNEAATATADDLDAHLLSFAAQIKALEVGQSASRTHHLAPSMTLAKLAEEMVEMKAQVRNNGMTAVRSAQKRTGHSYSAEVIETIKGGRVNLILIVTRES